MVTVGDTAPAFTLRATDKREVSLSEFGGQTIVMVFYPGAFTGVCDKELCAFRDSMDALNKADAVVLGISVDSPWANAELLSDLNREAVHAYDASFVGLGGIDGYVSANRVVIIVDSAGVVRYRWVAENPGVEPNYDEVVAAAAAL